MVSRIIKNRILVALKPGKVQGLFGARLTRKTILMSEIIGELTQKYHWLIEKTLMYPRYYRAREEPY